MHFDHSGALADKYLATALEGDEPVVIFDMVEGCIYGDKFVQNVAGSYRGKVYIEQYNEYNGASPYPSSTVDDWDDASRNINTLQTWIDTFWPYDCEKGVGIIGGPWTYIDYSQDPPVTVTIPVGEWETTGVSGGGPSDTAPDAMFYGGWYHGSPDYMDVYGWLPGSAAAHLMNGPANDRLRGPFTDPLASDAWCTQALARGLSVALGRCSWTRAPGQASYFGEEFRPEIFVYYMTHGYNFAESCYASMEYMKCLDLPVGGPIYCPLYSGKTPLDDAASLPPRVLVGDGPQANSKMISISAGTMAGDHTTVPTEMYLFRLDVGTAKDSLQTLYDYDACARYSIYQRYIVTQMADATPLQSGQIYWLKVYAKDPSGNVWESPFTAFAGEGPITDPTVNLDTALSPTDVLDRYLNPSDPDAAIWGNNINPMWISDSGDGRAVYEFNLPAAVPKDALIIKAALNVYWNFRTVAGGTDPTICNVFAMQRAWNEAQVNWLQADTGQNWARQGVSCGGIDSGTYALHAMERSYYPVSIPYFEGTNVYENADPFVKKEIDITGIVNEWIAETTPNYGVMIDNPAEPDDSNLAFSTEGVAESSPSLDIYWKCEPPMVTVTAVPQESGADRGSTQAVDLTATVTPPAWRTVVSYTWDFGDGSAPVIVTTAALSDLQTHNFSPRAQPYTVTVTVQNEYSVDSSSRPDGVGTIQVTVTTNPIAVIDLPSAYVLVDQAVQLDGSASYDPDGTPIAAWDWDSSATPIGSGETISYTWTAAGTPTLTLTVTDGDVSSVQDTASVSLQVVATAAEMPPGVTIDSADLQVQVTDDLCLAPYLLVGGTAVPLTSRTTDYTDYAVTVPLTIAGQAYWTLQMIDASGNSSQLSVEILRTVSP